MKPILTAPNKMIIPMRVEQDGMVGDGWVEITPTDPRWAQWEQWAARNTRGEIVGDTVLKFNPYHDELGRFTTGGDQAGNAPPAPSLHERARATESKSDKKAQAYIEGEFADPYGERDYGMEDERIAGPMKAKVVADLTKAVLAGPHAKALKPEQWPEWINAVVGTWSHTAADYNPDAIAMQMAVAREFGTSKESMALVDKHAQHADVIDKARRIDRESGVVNQAVARAMYDRTQAELKAAGIDYVTLHRGMGLPVKSAPKWWLSGETASAGDFHQFHQFPMSSWSSDYRSAKGFAEMQSDPGMAGVTASARFPRERILSTPRTGPGCLKEYEFVTLDTPGTVRLVLDHANPD